MPELDDDVAPDDATGTDADESENADVITDAALMRVATARYEGEDEAQPKDEPEAEGDDGGS